MGPRMDRPPTTCCRADRRSVAGSGAMPRLVSQAVAAVGSGACEEVIIGGVLRRSRPPRSHDDLLRAHLERPKLFTQRGSSSGDGIAGRRRRSSLWSEWHVWQFLWGVSGHAEGCQRVSATCAREWPTLGPAIVECRSGPVPAGHRSRERLSIDPLSDMRLPGVAEVPGVKV
jgi:hypothetical protein